MGQLLSCMEISTGLFPRLEERKDALGMNELAERIFANFQGYNRNTPFNKKKTCHKISLLIFRKSSDLFKVYPRFKSWKTRYLVRFYCSR